MADSKAKPASSTSAGPWIIASVIGIFLALVFISRGIPTTNDGGLPTYLNLEYVFYRIAALLQAIWEALVNGSVYAILVGILTIVGIAMAIIIAYTHIRSKEIEKEQEEAMKKVAITIPTNEPKNPRWDNVKKHMATNNESEWRQAIIDADIILDEMVNRMGYKGENLGERLKVIEASDFTTLQDAWDAHKVRNQIAHDGSNFELTEHEAKRVIGLYERVFREFDFI